MKTFVMTQFILCLVHIIIASVVISTREYPYMQKKTLAEALVGLLITFGMLFWSGIILFMPKF